MGVSRDTLERIKAALDPLSVVRDAVPSLKLSGTRWKGNCPFHNERTPSFYFQPDKGLWHCFGACQEGGDIVSFVMKLENLSFPDALRELARRTGVELDWDKSDDGATQRAKERDQLLGLLEDAAGFYQKSLASLAEGEIARRYLVQRGVRPETTAVFRLGYAPRQDGFLDQVLKKGTPIELLLKAGLAIRSERTARYQDALSGRLIFPIRDAYGQVVAFGGRVLGDDSGPKYINSSETPVYTKGRHLYGLYDGRVSLRELAKGVVVEGYMDVVGLHQAGVSNAVAPLGTALTSEQARLLRRYVQEVVLLFDPDDAGRRASWRGADVLLKEDVFVRVAQIPGGDDPDEFVASKGLGALQEVLSKSQDVVDFWLDLLAPELREFNDLHGRLRRAEELLRFVGQVPNEMLRAEWIQRVANRLSFDPAALRRHLGQKAGTKTTPLRRETPPVVPEKKMGFSVRTAEEEVLQVLGFHPELWVGLSLDDGLFFDTRCRTVFRHWRDQHSTGRVPDPTAAVSVLGAGDGPWLTALLLEGKKFDTPSESLAQGVVRLKNLALRREHRTLENNVQSMTRGERPRDEEVLARYHILTRQLKATSPESSGLPTDR